MSTSTKPPKLLEVQYGTRYAGQKYRSHSPQLDADLEAVGCTEMMARVARAIVWCLGKGKTSCSPSLAYLSEVSRIPERALWNHVQALHDEDIIPHVSGGKGKANVYNCQRLFDRLNALEAVPEKKPKRKGRLPALKKTEMIEDEEEISPSKFVRSLEARMLARAPKPANDSVEPPKTEVMTTPETIAAEKKFEQSTRTAPPPPKTIRSQFGKAKLDTAATSSKTSPQTTVPLTIGMTRDCEAVIVSDLDAETLAVAMEAQGVEMRVLSSAEAHTLKVQILGAA